MHVFPLSLFSYFILHPHMIYVLYFNIIQAFRLLTGMTTNALLRGISINRNIYMHI